MKQHLAVTMKLKREVQKLYTHTQHHIHTK